MIERRKDGKGKESIGKERKKEREEGRRIFAEREVEKKAGGGRINQFWKEGRN